MLNFDNVKIVNYADSYNKGYIKIIVISIFVIFLSILLFRIMIKKDSKKSIETNNDKGYLVYLLSLIMFVSGIILPFAHEAPYLDIYVETKPTNVLTLSEMKKHKEYFKEIDGKMYFLYTMNKIAIGSNRRVQDKNYIISETQEAFKKVSDPLWFDSKIK